MPKPPRNSWNNGAKRNRFPVTAQVSKIMIFQKNQNPPLVDACDAERENKRQNSAEKNYGSLVAAQDSSTIPPTGDPEFVEGCSVSLQAPRNPGEWKSQGMQSFFQNFQGKLCSPYGRPSVCNNSTHKGSRI